MDSSPDTLDLTNLKNAVAALERAVKVSTQSEGFDAETCEVIRAGVIQSFAFTYELCWKFMKRWIEMNTTPAVVEVMFTKKELFRKSAELNLIIDPVTWFGFSAARNKTSHTYDGDTANNVAAVAKEFLPYAQDFLARLEQRL
ncbi:MAG: nucleotidyltransferase substrate binding protein [Planctomycetota bacterium]|jgi:nucleotidyltransferase substrate binding protein (TIGR01987 family)|nr:nucleotidyltransferase substrate binding protein [Planctomycetota bacterium]